MNYFLIAVLSIAAYAAAETEAIPYPQSAPSATYGAPIESGQQIAGPYLQQYSQGPEAFNIQSGFEGYLVPSALGAHSLIPLKESLDALGSGAGLLKVLKPLTKLSLKIIPKIGAVLLGVIVLFLLGGLFTTGVCSLTPICTITFLGWGFSRESMRSYLTQDKLSSTAGFVLDAIKKYKELYDTSANEIETEKKSRK